MNTLIINNLYIPHINQSVVIDKNKISFKMYRNMDSLFILKGLIDTNISFVCASNPYKRTYGKYKLIYENYNDNFSCDPISIEFRKMIILTLIHNVKITIINTIKKLKF